jgi:hypothetical protein
MAGPDTQTRRNLAKQGRAMPDAQGSGGRFPIRNRSDLLKAIKAVGRAKGGEEGRRKVRRFIIRRARELGLSSAIPDSWAGDGSVKSSAS